MSVCVDLSFVKFGDCKKPTSSLSVNISSVTKNVSETIMNTVNSMQTTTIAVQNQNISIDGACCGKLTILQDAALKVIDKTKVDTVMVNSILQQLSQQYSSELDRVQPELNKLAGNNIGRQITTSVKSAFQKTIERESVKNSVREKLLKTIANQSQDIQIKCNEYIPTDFTGECTITQDMVLQMEMTNLIEEVFMHIQSDTNVASAIKAYTQQKYDKEPEPIAPFVPFWKPQIKQVGGTIVVLAVILLLRSVTRRK